MPEDLRQRYESEARRDGFRALQFTDTSDGRMGPAGKREEYFPVYFVEPFKGNEKALGFDLASNPARRERAQRNNRRPHLPGWRPCSDLDQRHGLRDT